MADMLLREVCNLIGISRRALQGYEKAKLVAHTGKTDKGYFLYDDEAQKRICEIKFYQDMKFQIREIKVLLDASKEERRMLLEKQLTVLKKEHEQIKITIEKAIQLLEAL